MRLTALPISAALMVLVATCGREALGPPTGSVTNMAGASGVAGAAGSAGAPGDEDGSPCDDGATRCASNESSQRCESRSWSSAVACPFVCIGGMCGQNPKTVFVTSSTFVGGSIGGLAGADAACQKLALKAMLSGTYRAWLSDSTGSPASRFSKGGGPYQLLDGTTIANNWTELTSSPLLHAIDVTDQLQTPTPISDSCLGAVGVWSDTTENGKPFFIDSSCGDWSDPTSVQLEEGSATSVDNWSYFCAGGGDGACAMSLALFCFEQ